MTGIKESLYDLLIDINIPEVLATVIISAIAIAVWIFIGILAQLIIKNILYKVLKVKRKGPRALTIGKLTSSISKYFIWFIVGMGILNELNVNVTPFIASAGVIGLAIGFGST